jgi:hypothetical protein
MTARVVASMAELYPLLDLRNVRINEVSAKRKDGFEGIEGAPAELRQQEISVSISATDSRLNYRCRMEMDTEKALLVADIEAQFSLGEPIEQLSMELVNEFSRAIGLPVVVPYLRVQAQQLARQIGVPAPMLKPLWKPDFEKVDLQYAHGGKQANRDQA